MNGDFAAKFRRKLFRQENIFNFHIITLTRLLKTLKITLLLIKCEIKLRIKSNELTSFQFFVVLLMELFYSFYINKRKNNKVSEELVEI